MTSPVNIPETAVYGGRVVCPGDTVEILPVELREQHEEAGDYFARQTYDHLVRDLGQGPFTISSIVAWPCGLTVLNLDGAKAPNAGRYAREFK